MMFLFAIPIFEAIAILFLPQMLGARDLPFPRLSAFGFWASCSAGSSSAARSSSTPRRAAAGSCIRRSPPSYQPGIGADIWLLGFSFIEVAAIAAAVELIVGVLKCRPPGMRINLIPLYAWYVLVAAAMMLFAFPPLIAGSLLLELERAFQLALLRSGAAAAIRCCGSTCSGSSATRGLHHLPAVGRAGRDDRADVRAHADRRLQLDRAGRGRHRLPELRPVGAPHVHDRAAGHLARPVLGGVEAVAIPTGVQIFCFLATLLAGRVDALGADALRLRRPGDLRARRADRRDGGAGAVRLPGARHLLRRRPPALRADRRRALSDPRRLSTTSFRSSTARQLSDRLGTIAFWLMFVGFNVAFLPMHLTGLRGMPRRVFTYPAGLGFDALNLVSSIGAFILAAGIAVVVWDVVRPKGKQPYSRAQSVGRRHARVAAGDAGQAVGRALDPGDRQPLSAVGPAELRCATSTKAASTCPTPRKGKRETLVTSVDRRAAACSACACRGRRFITLFAALFTGGVLHLRHVPLWWLAVVSARAGARRHRLLAVDRHGHHPGERRRRTSASA